MEFSKTDDLSLELSAILEKISSSDCGKVKLSGSKSKLPSPYNDIMKTNFPPISPKSEKKTDNRIDSDIIDTVAGLNIYNRQIISMDEIDKITWYYPELDGLEQTEPSPAKKKNDSGDAEDSLEKLNASQENSNETRAIGETSSLENRESYEKHANEASSKEEPENSNDHIKESQVIKSEDLEGSDESKTCCFGLGSKNSEESVLGEETEYGPLIEDSNENSFDERLPTRFDFSDINLSEENKSTLSSDQMIFLDSTESQDPQLSSTNMPQVKKKPSILKRLFSRHHN